MSKLNLLSRNAKLEKSVKVFGIVTAGLFLAPHRRSGTNLCPNAGFCSAVCNLWFSGRTVTSTVRNAMMRRAKLFLEQPAEFERQITADIVKLAKLADKQAKRLFIRPNGASDLDFSAVAENHPDVCFYDYTKRADFIRRKLHGDWPQNYALCYSYSERMDKQLAVEYLQAGGTVAVVFDADYHPQSGKIGELPSSFEIGGQRFKVIDGDVHDLRHPDYDGHGVIVGLRFKGSRKLLQESIDIGFTVSASKTPISV